MKNKGFTLIELLAVIVVLAIIALIATPMILNVVEKARKGAAKSSALGYIDAVEKQIMVNQLNDNPEILDGEYSLPMDSTYKVSIKGSKPSNGNMTITKSKVASATMCINNYTVTYDGKTATVENKCNGTEAVSNIPTIDSCPGCVYAYTTQVWSSSETPTTLTSDQYKENYEDVVSETGKNYFLGMKLNASGTIEKAYACGIKDGETFCLEGSRDGSTYNANKTLLQSERLERLYNNGCTESDGGDDGFYVSCDGSVNAYAYDNGDVSVSAGYSDCHVNYAILTCYEY